MTHSIFAVPIGVLLFLFSSGASARFYTGVDVGTSFSPHGAGASIGYIYEDLISAEIGTGRSKGMVAGLPVSLEFRTYHHMHRHFSLFVGVGGTYYQGRGERRLEFGSGRRNDSYHHTAEASWKIAYARLNVGAVTKRVGENIRAFGDVGGAFVTYSKIDVHSLGKDYDDTNLTHAKGVSTNGHYDQNSMGYGDFGVYGRLGVYYVFN